MNMLYKFIFLTKIPLTLLALLYASKEDIKDFHIPDVCFILIMILSGKPRIWDGVMVVVLWSGIAVIVSCMDCPVPLGMGDAKLLAALAFSYGLADSAKIFASAAVLSGLTALVIVIRAKISSEDTPRGLPFAPFIAAGFVLTVLFRAF